MCTPATEPSTGQTTSLIWRTRYAQVRVGPLGVIPSQNSNPPPHLPRPPLSCMMMLSLPAPGVRGASACPTMVHDSASSVPAAWPRRIACAWTASGRIAAAATLASDPFPPRSSFAGETGCAVTHDNRRVASHADLLVLSVKPQTMAGLLRSSSTSSARQSALVSRSRRGLRSAIARRRPWWRLRGVVRVMPNTPCLVGAGAIRLCPGRTPRPGMWRWSAAVSTPRRVVPCRRTSSRRRHRALGLRACVRLRNDRGPLRRRYVSIGLPRDIATAWPPRRCSGRRSMVLETGQHPGVQSRTPLPVPAAPRSLGCMRWRQRRCRGGLMDAVEAATRRSAELGKGK